MVEAKAGKLTGKHVLLYFILFFGVIFTVNAIFLTYAARSFPGEQVPKSYYQGVNYNAVLEDRKRQDALGWTIEMGLVETPSGEPRLETRWLDQQEAGVTSLRVEAHFRRPASDLGSFKEVLNADGPGFYTIEISDLQPGVWDIELTALRPSGDEVKAHKSLTWQN